MANHIDYFYDNEDYLKKLNVYTKNFSKEKLTAYEDELFSEKISRKKRAELEIARIKKVLLYNQIEDYAEYYDILVELGKLLKVSDLSSDILDEIYRIIVKIQLCCNIGVRLYSGIALLQEEERVIQLKKMVGEQDGKKRYR